LSYRPEKRRDGGNVRSAPPFLNSNCTFSQEEPSTNKVPKITDADPVEFSSKRNLSVS